jgi:hypothetical protein
MRAVQCLQCSRSIAIIVPLPYPYRTPTLPLTLTLTPSTSGSAPLTLTVTHLSSRYNTTTNQQAPGCAGAGCTSCFNLSHTYPGKEDGGGQMVRWKRWTSRAGAGAPVPVPVAAVVDDNGAVRVFFLDGFVGLIFGAGFIMNCAISP